MYLCDRRNAPRTYAKGLQIKLKLLERRGKHTFLKFPRQAVWLYGAADTPQRILDKFGVKKNYIGQLELLAAALAYFSLPELRHESVFHWIDNTSVLAALIKGYARAHASVRLLHAFKAFTFGLGVDSWFQWVPRRRTSLTCLLGAS